MRKWNRQIGITLLTFTLLVCCGFGSCSGSDIHKVKVANADLASALNKTAKTIIDLSNQGSVTAAEKTAILPRISDATILSDKIEDCTNAVTVANTLRGCVTPLLAALKNDIDPAAIGVKSSNAQAILTSVLSGASIAIDVIVSVGGN